jgi:hypothetical protein
MHDSGGGKRSMTPFYSDFSRFTTTTSNSFGGITGGSSSSPDGGVVDYVSLDNDGRVYVYSDHDVMYSPSVMIRMYASEPARQLGHHVCTKRLVQERADGANIPFAIEHDHYWTNAVVLPAGRDPVLSPSSTCLPALRNVGWRWLARWRRSRPCGLIGR